MNKVSNKEHNFISAIVFLSDDSGLNIHFLDKLYECLDDHFLQFEIIALVDGNTKDTAGDLRNWGKKKNKPLTIISMSLWQSHEQCMNAGLDCSIGDFIYEFDSVEMPYDPKLIWDAYELAQQGNDIVTVGPEKEKLTSKVFYKIFNNNSHASYELRTNIFRLISRRALNRVHSTSDNLPYRKAAYATCGLKMAELVFPETICGNTHERFSLAADSLVLYTNFGYKLSLGFTALMIFISFAETVYTVAIWIAGRPIIGWTTTMFVITLGMTGLFTVLAIVLKYLTLLLQISFTKQGYLIENIEKI